MRPQKLTHYSLRDAAHGYVAALYLRSKGTRHFPAALLKVSSSTSGANSLVAAAATTSGPDDTATRIKACPRTRSDVVATVLGVPRKKRCPTS